MSADRLLTVLRPVLAAAIVVMALVPTAEGQTHLTPNQPIGNRDGTSTNANTIFTWGWTCDPDNWSMSLRVDIYIDGTYSTGTMAGSVTANTNRPDVSSVCNGTTLHGYGFWIPRQFLTHGTHTIYAYAIDDGGIGPNPLLGASPLSYQVFNISGNAGRAGATVTAGGSTATADASGNYTLTGMVTGTFSVAPSSSGCTFTPSSQNVNVNADVSGINFSAACAPPTYSVSGSAGVASATVSTTGHSTTANPAGTYTLTGLNAGTYAITPSKSGCTFTPSSRNVTVGPDASSVNFTANCPPPTYSISGTTNLGATLVSTTGASATADSSGHYTLSGLVAGTYQVSATAPSNHSNCAFTPISVTVGPSTTTANLVGACNLTWDSLITRNDRQTYLYADWSHSTSGATLTHFPSNAPPTPTWEFSGPNETIYAAIDAPTFPLSSVPYGSAILSSSFLSKAPLDPNYKVSMTLDKLNHSELATTRPDYPYGPSIDVAPAYTDYFMQDDILLNGTEIPNFSRDLYLDVRVKLVSHSVGTGTPPQPPGGFIANPLDPYAGFPSSVVGMSRVTLGFAIWDMATSSTRFMEVVLWRDSSYDGCQNSGLPMWWGATWSAFNNASWKCDTSGLYDRRFNTGNTTPGTEIVYFYGPSMGVMNRSDIPATPTMFVGSTATVHIPITRLFGTYFVPGVADLPPPANLQTVQLHEVYMGIETWGKAATTIEIDNYRLYSQPQNGNP